MKKFVLAAMAAAAAASFSGSALAVDLTVATPVPETFASELVTAGTTTVKGTTVRTELGFGVSANQTRYVRYDFTNSKFGTGGLTAADLAVAGLGAGDIILSSGGAAGGTNVIFQITAPAGGIAQGDFVDLTLANGLVPTALGPIDVTYRLYETASAAVAGSGQLAQDAGTIIVFASGVSFTATQTTTTVDVASSPTYSKFLPANPAGIPTAVKAEIGKVSLNPTLGAKKPDGGVVTLNDLLGAGTAITLAGADLSAAIANTPGISGLTFNPTGCANAATILGTSRTATSVSFVLPAVAPIAAASLCFEVPAGNKNPIAAQAFTADVAPGAVANVPTPDIPAVAAGTFVRNGLVLKAAFAETTTAAGISSAVHLTNTTGTAAPFTVNCVLNSGSVAGTPGTLPASTAQRFSITSGLGCPSNGTMRGVEIVFARTPGSVIGSVVRQNTTTGLATFDSMTGNQ